MPRVIPAGMPVLSRGRHRHPRRGACLMEYTSVLAGVRFSDAPSCTDPTLAAVARCVNDYTTDAGRQRLAVFAAELATAVDLSRAEQQAVARRCLLTGLRYASGSRRRTLLVAVLGLERAAAGNVAGFCPADLGLDVELALLDQGDVGGAARVLNELRVGLGQHHNKGVAMSIELSASAIAAEADHPDEVLYDLLVECLGDHRRAQRSVPAPRPVSSPLTTRGSSG